MGDPTPTPAQSGNRLLARLPADAYRRLLPHLKTVPLPFEHPLHEARKPIKYAYFPTRGMASAVTRLQDGAGIEVVNIGSEGATGTATVLGVVSSPNEVFMQVEGEGVRVEVAALTKEATRDSPLWRLLGAYHAFFLFHVSQSVACNGLHSVHQRCCRWLLLTHDRVDTDVLPLTHGFLAMMLGVRASVTLVLQPLQDQGLVRYARGRITILNRPGLEVAACECYQAVQDEYARLLP